MKEIIILLAAIFLLNRVGRKRKQKKRSSATAKDETGLRSRT